MKFFEIDLGQNKCFVLGKKYYYMMQASAAAAAAAALVLFVWLKGKKVGWEGKKRFSIFCVSDV
jgi:hypothetical protein